MVLVRIVAPEILAAIYPAVFTDMFVNTIISELIIVVPALVFLMICRPQDEKLSDFLGFHKIRLASVAKIFLYTWFVMPLVGLANMISMLFVDNAILQSSGQILSQSFPVMLFAIAIYGPFCEELVCRGVMYHGYKKSGNLLRAMLISSLLFGLMHMNLNQAPYAFIVGVSAVLLLEATGSLWSTILHHFIFNAQTVCYMFLLKQFRPGLMEQAMEQTAGISSDMMFASICLYLVLAVGGTALAGCVLVWIAKGEKRQEQIKNIWESRKDKKERVCSIPLVLGIVLSAAYMIMGIMLGNLFG